MQIYCWYWTRESQVRLFRHCYLSSFKLQNTSSRPCRSFVERTYLSNVIYGEKWKYPTSTSRWFEVAIRHGRRSGRLEKRYRAASTLTVSVTLIWNWKHRDYDCRARVCVYVCLWGRRRGEQYFRSYAFRRCVRRAWKTNGTPPFVVGSRLEFTFEKPFGTHCRQTEITGCWHRW